MPKFLNFDATRALRVLAALAGIAALYFGREVLIPVALAVLLTFLLHPVVHRLQRWGLPRVAGVIVGVGVLASVTGVIGYIVVEQAIDLGDQLPNYQDNLRQKARRLRESGQGALARFTGTLHVLKKELSSTQPNPSEVVVTRIGSSPLPAATGPMKVEVVSEQGLTDVASRFALPLIAPLTMIGITLLLLIFLLLHSDDVRERIIWVAGMRQMSLTTAALDEAAERIGRYLRMQLVVNLTYGTLVAIGLALIGLPGAIMWGVIAGLLRFVPFLGPWLGAAMPLLLAIAVFPTWGHSLAVLGWMAVCEIIANTVLEPWLYGASTGMSSVGVVLAAVFWAWVWGPVGLILAVPITVCLVVLGKHVPQLALFNQLFGTEGAVPQVARLYQRLLISDEVAAEEIVSEEIKEQTLVRVADQLLLPVLCEMKRDLALRLIGREQVREAIRTLEMIIPMPEPTLASSEPCPRLLAVPGPNVVDEAAARLLARVATTEQIPAEAMSHHALASEVAARAAECNAAAVSIVQVHPVAPSHARHIVKTLESRIGEQIQLIELLVDGSCMPEPVPPVPGSPAAAAPIVTPRRPAAESRAGTLEVRRERSVRELLEHLSDLRQPAPTQAAAPKPEPEPARA